MRLQALATKLAPNKSGAVAILGLLVILWSRPLHAGPITYDFTGVLNSTITVGTSSIPAGSFFSGELSYDVPQTGVVTPFVGGTQSVFEFNSLTLTIDGQTVVEAPGNLGLYNNVNSTVGVPTGDSFYTFVPGDNNGPGPSTGTIDGVTPDFFYLGFVDSSSQAFSSSDLPQSLTLSEFSEAFLGVDYGPLGTGNTDTIFPVSSLNTVSTPEPPTLTIVVIGLSILATAMLRTRRRRSYSSG
jgi:hypothetical protein